MCLNQKSFLEQESQKSLISTLDDTYLDTIPVNSFSTSARVDFSN